MYNDLLKGLTDEQIAKARACKNKDELLSLAKAESVELTEEQLAAVSGGACLDAKIPDPVPCPRCGTEGARAYSWDHSDGVADYRCEHCGHVWVAKFK